MSLIAAFCTNCCVADETFCAGWPLVAVWPGAAAFGCAGALPAVGGNGACDWAKAAVVNRVAAAAARTNALMDILQGKKDAAPVRGPRNSQCRPGSEVPFRGQPPLLLLPRGWSPSRGCHFHN